MIPKQYKVNACLTVLLAVVFYLFWQLCKQQSALAQVATFTEDPYDGIGSIGTQFAIFTALLSVIRAFRPYQPNKASRAIDSQQVLLVRGAYLTCLSIAVTVGADIVAMLRFPTTWIGFPAGYMLVALVVGMALLAALTGWYIHHTTRESMMPSAHQGWARAISISLAGAVICALYPENWRQSITLGGLWTVFVLFTIVVGMTIFFAVVWAWGTVISPPLETSGEDFLDDLAALYHWFKAHIGHFRVLLTPGEKILGSSFLRPLVNWLNPRKNRWYGIALIGALIGLMLATGEGGQIGRFEIFAGIECLAVLMGYAIFVKPLELARNDTMDKRKLSSPPSSEPVV